MPLCMKNEKGCVSHVEVETEGLHMPHQQEGRAHSIHYWWREWGSAISELETSIFNTSGFFFTAVPSSLEQLLVNQAVPGSPALHCAECPTFYSVNSCIQLILVYVSAIPGLVLHLEGHTTQLTGEEEQARFGLLIVTGPWEAGGGKGWTPAPLTTTVIISSPIPDPRLFPHAGDSRMLQQVFNAV